MTKWKYIVEAYITPYQWYSFPQFVYVHMLLLQEVPEATYIPYQKFKARK